MNGNESCLTSLLKRLNTPHQLSMSTASICLYSTHLRRERILQHALLVPDAFLKQEAAIVEEFSKWTERYFNILQPTPAAEL